MPFNLALKMHFDDLDIHSWTDYLSTTCRKKGCHSMLFASFTRMTTCNHNQGQVLKLLTTDFKGNKVYAIIVGLKAVNVTAYCVFISVNSVHSPIVNPELKTLPIQWNRVLNMQYIAKKLLSSKADIFSIKYQKSKTQVICSWLSSTACI